MKRNILKTIEPYYLVATYMFIGFFIVMTGINLLPKIVEINGEDSFVPLLYSLSIWIAFLYFFYYKPFKLVFNDEDKQ